jgi:hypothetical protein
VQASRIAIDAWGIMQVMWLMGRKLSKAIKDRKVSKTFRLAPSKITAAQRALGAATAPEAIESKCSPRPVSLTTS